MDSIEVIDEQHRVGRVEKTLVLGPEFPGPPSPDCGEGANSCDSAPSWPVCQIINKPILLSVVALHLDAF